MKFTVIGVLLLLAFNAKAQSTGTVYISKSSTSRSLIYKVTNPGTPSSDTIAFWESSPPLNASNTISAIAYNSNDDKLYIIFQSGSISKMDLVSKALTSLPITGVTAGPAAVAMDIFNNTVYVQSSQSSAAGTIFKVNLITNTVSSVSTSSTETSLVRYSDFVYYNGFLYGINFNNSTSSSWTRIFRTDVNTGVSTMVNPNPLFSSPGAAWRDDTGNFYFEGAGRYNVVTNQVTTDTATGSGFPIIVGQLDGTWVPAHTPLPIKISSFTAREQKSNVVLNWVTGETDEEGTFFIERSADGNSFQTIGNVVATKGRNNYSFTDAQPLQGVNFYRIRQTDPDTKTFYTNIRQININGANTVKLYPNPATNQLAIEGLKGSEEIAIYNTIGQKMLKTDAKTAASGIVINQLSAGLYRVVISSGNSRVHTATFVKQ